MTVQCRNACLHHYSTWSDHDLDLWPLTLITFSAVHTHRKNICTKFHWNPSTMYRDITSRRIDLNGQWTNGSTMDERMDGRPKYMLPQLQILWRAMENAKDVKFADVTCQYLSSMWWLFKSYGSSVYLHFPRQWVNKSLTWHIAYSEEGLSLTWYKTIHCREKCFQLSQLHW